MAFTPAPANIRASVSARHRPASVIPTSALMPPARSAWRTTNTVRAGSAARARRQTASSASRRSPKVGVGLISASILQAASGVDEGRSQLTRGQGRKTVSNAGESPRRILTPLRGWGVSGTVPPGLRRGLLSCAPSGLGRRIPRTSRNLPAGVFHEFPRAAGPLQQGRKTVSNAGESPRRILTPLRGWGFQERFPTAYAVGYDLAPLRGWAGESLEHRGICLPAFFMNFRGPQALYNRPGGPPHWARTQTVIILVCFQVELAFLPSPRLRLAPWRAARSSMACCAMAAARASWALR